MGRRDSTTANRTAAGIFLPGPTLPLDVIITMFSTMGLDTTDLVALSGNLLFIRAHAHTQRNNMS